MLQKNRTILSAWLAAMLFVGATDCAEVHRTPREEGDPNASTARSRPRRSGAVEPTLDDEPDARPTPERDAPDASQGTPDATPADADESADPSQSTAITPWLFIAASDRIDAVHDASRKMVYVSTRHGEVLMYSTVIKAVAATFKVDGIPYGLDLSPDENKLFVADMKSDQETQLSRIHVKDLLSGDVQSIVIHTQPHEAGTLTGVFLDDATLLVTSTYAGSGWAPMRRVQLVDGTVEELRQMTDETTLTTSADRSTVAYAQGNSSAGPFGRFDVPSGELDDAEAGGFVYEVGVSRDGQQLAVLKQGQALFYDAELNAVGSLGRSGNQEGPMFTGVVYSPTSDLVYLSATSRDIRSSTSSSTIQVVDTRSLTTVTTIDSTHTFDWIGNHPFDSGRLRISRDGTLLLATVAGGVMLYKLGER